MAWSDTAAPSHARFRPGGFAALAALAALLGGFFLFLWNGIDRQREVDAWRGHLTAVANDRGLLLEGFLRERSADLRTLAAFPTVTYLVAAEVSGPIPFPIEEGPAHHLAAIFTTAAREYGYTGIWLIGRDGGVLAASQGAPELDAAHLARSRADLVLGTAPVRIHLDGHAARLSAGVVIPDASGRPAAILVAELDPERHLYPTLRAEALPSRTGESNLVRAEGGGITYLAPTRHGGQTPLPVHRERTPGGADGAALGAERMFGRFLDYRGVPVLAASRRIAGTDWALLVKVDEEEAFADHRRTFWLALLSLLTLIVTLLGCGFVLWRAERLRQEERMGEYRSALALLLDRTGEAVLVLGADGAIRHANERARTLYGYGAGEWNGKNLADLVLPSELDAQREAFLSRARPGASLFEAVHRRRDGGEIQVEVSRATLERDGEVLAVALIRDIGERKAREARREGRLAVLQSIATGAPLATSLDSVARFVEKQFPGIRATILLLDGNRLRHAAAPSLPVEFQQGIDGQEIGPDRGTCGAAAFLGEPVVSTDLRSDPKWADFRELAERNALRACWSIPIRTADGKVAGTFALYAREPGSPSSLDQRLIENATHLAAIAIDRHRAEEALRHSAEELRVTFAGAAIGMALVEPDGRLIRANPAFERLLNHDPGGLDGRHFREFTVPEDVEPDEELYRSLLAGERSTYQLEKRYLAKDGKHVWGRLTVSLVRNQDGSPRFAVAMVEDLTEQRRWQEGMQQAVKMEAIGRLAGGIAHDFNNLLGVVLGYGQLAVELVPEQGEVRAHLERMIGAAERGSDLTRQLLAFSRRQPVDPKILDVGEAVEGFAAMVEGLLPRNLTLSVRVEPGCGRVRADRGQLEQVLMNLFVNARDAMADGGELVLEARSVEVEAAFVELHARAKPGPHVRISVIDNGTGMEPEILERIFEPFFTTKEVGKGTGLGLSTVYGIVQQSGGFLEVESVPGGGTRFDIYLPRIERGQAPEDPPALADGGGQETETTLLVENDPSLRRLLLAQLSGLGYRAAAAESGTAALRLLAEPGSKVRRLVIDLGLEDPDGSEIARQARLLRPDIQVLFLAGRGMGPDPAGLSGETVLAKPFNREGLAAALREVSRVRPS